LDNIVINDTGGYDPAFASILDGTVFSFAAMISTLSLVVIGAV
jgi:hypothetical protein